MLCLWNGRNVSAKGPIHVFDTYICLHAGAVGYLQSDICPLYRLQLASASNYSEFGVDPNMYEVGVAAHRDVCLSVLFNAMEFERKPQPQTCSRSPHFHITFLLQPVQR